MREATADRVSGQTNNIGPGSQKRELLGASDTLARAREAKGRHYGLAALPTEAPTDPFGTAKRITTPKAAIAEHCRLCMNGDRRLVRECTSTACPLWVFRMGPAPSGSGSRVKEIRAFYLTCGGGPDVPERYREVKACSAGRCPLWPWRTGRRLPEYYLDRPGAESREPGTVRQAPGGGSCDAGGRGPGRTGGARGNQGLSADALSLEDRGCRAAASGGGGQEASACGGTGAVPLASHLPAE